MNYIQGLPEQSRIFLLSVGFGFVLGILYDVFRIVRLVVSPGKRLVAVYDVVYVILCAFLSFLFFLTVNNGAVRGYALFALLLGWAVYYLSLGIFVVKLTSFLVNLTRRIFSAIMRPVNSFLRFAGKKLLRLRTFLIKNTKKIQKKFKLLLKLYTLLVYNLKRIAVYSKKQE